MSRGQPPGMATDKCITFNLKDSSFYIDFTVTFEQILGNLSHISLGDILSNIMNLNKFGHIDNRFVHYVMNIFYTQDLLLLELKELKSVSGVQLYV